MTIRLTTLGGLRVVVDDDELENLPGQRLRAALLVYLAVERCASRASLVTVFWPEADEDRARQALRQSLYHLRKALGPGWVESHAHELRTGPVIATDVGAFDAAIEQGEAETAARLYAGPFLDGVNLVDLKPWETWVDSRRAQLARQFRKVCREWLEARQAAGDLAGALEAARCWVAPDPFDDEAQHRLIEALADAGERAEALRQFAIYARLLESDGLRPLDDTIHLIDRIRSEAMPWPEPPMRSVASAGGASRPVGRERTFPRLMIVGLLLLLGAYLFADADRAAVALESLTAAGTIEQGERILLADFDGPPAAPELGRVVTDALRVDLLGTGVLGALGASEVRETLGRMLAATSRPLRGARRHRQRDPPLPPSHRAMGGCGPRPAAPRRTRTGPHRGAGPDPPHQYASLASHDVPRDPTTSVTVTAARVGREWP